MAMPGPGYSIQTATIPSPSKLFDDGRVCRESDICDGTQVGGGIDLLDLLQGSLVKEGFGSKVVGLVYLVQSIHNTLTDRDLVNLHCRLWMNQILCFQMGILWWPMVMQNIFLANLTGCSPDGNLSRIDGAGGSKRRQHGANCAAVCSAHIP